jgi:hypothetical protein
VNREKKGDTRREMSTSRTSLKLKNKLEVDEFIARPRAKEVVLKHKEVSLKQPTDKAQIMVADLSIMDPMMRDCF